VSGGGAETRPLTGRGGESLFALSTLGFVSIMVKPNQLQIVYHNENGDELFDYKVEK